MLIASFPLYYFGLPAQLKALLDRTISLMEPYHGQTPEGGHCSFQTLRDPALRRKKLVVISSCGYTEAAPMYEALLAQLDRLCSGRNYTPLFFPQGELLPVEKLNGPRAAVCRPSRRQAGICRNGNALGADACRGAAADGRSPCL